MRLHATTFATPAGLFSCALDAAGAVVATAFGDVSDLRGRLPACDLTPGAADAARVRDQVHEYFAGARRSFDLPLAPVGTAFQHRVWTALRAIPLGETRTYREIAAMIGNPAAARAVGRANATNPLCLLVPCHRVIGSDGSLTGFAFGEGIKRWLLEHERGLAAQGRAA
jgi:methylated-DNA-[protein]-cysteine S-methyltransferase